jgi:hypothetical protein
MEADGNEVIQMTYGAGTSKSVDLEFLKVSANDLRLNYWSGTGFDVKGTFSSNGW